MKRAKARARRANVLLATRTELERSRLRLFGVGLICAKVALVPVVIDPLSDLPFIVPKVLVSHGLSYVLAGVLTGLAVQFGRELFVRSWLHIPVIAYLLASVAATLLAADTALALYGTHTRMLGLGSIADGVLLYCAVFALVRRRVEVVALIASVLGAAAIVVAYELVQLMGRDPFRWSFDGSVSPFATLGQPTTLAFYLTITAVGAFALALAAKELNRPIRVTLVIYAGALLAGAAATGTRSALVGVATGSAALITLLMFREMTRRARVITALVMTAAAVSVAIAIAVSPLGARLSSTIQTSGGDDSDDVMGRLDPSSVSRVTLYGIAFQLVRDRPLLGHGPDNFIVGVPQHRPENAPPQLRQSLASSAHSWVAYVATSSGLVGLSAFIAVIGVAFVLAWRARAYPIATVAAAALAAYLGTGFTTVTDVATDAVLWLSVAAIGSTAAASTLRSEETAGRRGRVAEARSRGSALAGRVVPFAAVLVGLVLLASTTRAAEASRSARASQESRLLRAVPQSIESGIRATQLDPGRAEYWHQLGLAYVGASRWREAGAAFDRAAAIAPYDVRHLTDLVAVHLILFSSGDGAARAKALELANQATRIDPNNPGAQLTRATVLHTTGNIPEAIRAVERALVLDPQAPNERLYGTAARIYIDAGRASDAVRIARQGRAILGVSSTPALGFELARALLASGQPREALTEIDLVLSLQPNYPAAERLRAEINARLGG